MGKINRKALIISLILTVVCAVVLFNYIRNLKAPTTERAKTAILVSVRDILPGDVITAVDVRSIEISTDSVPEGIVMDKAAIEGKYAKEAILLGEPFREQRLAKLEELSLAYNLADGYRAVSLFVNESNLLSMQIMTGDYVDVIASWSLDTKNGDPVKLTKTVLQRIQVLAIGPNRVLDELAGAPKRDVYNLEDMPKTVTLAVTPKDAEILVFNSVNSNYTLALRGKDDDKVETTDGAVVTDMIPQRFLPFAVMPGGASSANSSTSSIGKSSGSTETTSP
jgi:Flp pilus assembly protein CpaB